MVYVYFTPGGANGRVYGLDGVAWARPGWDGDNRLVDDRQTDRQWQILGWARVRLG